MIFPGFSLVKNMSANAGDMGTIPGSRRSLGEGNSYALQYSFLENPHGQRILVGYSPWGCKELDTTQRLMLSFSKSTFNNLSKDNSTGL